MSNTTTIIIDTRRGTIDALGYGNSSQEILLLTILSPYFQWDRALSLRT
jgi:hypothetical protein